MSSGVEPLRRAPSPRPPSCLVLATTLGDAAGGLAVAAAAALALAAGRAGALVVEVGGVRGRGPTLLASAWARRLEESLRAAGHPGAAARGGLCWLSLPPAEEALGEMARALEAVEVAAREHGHPSVPPPPAAVAHLGGGLWRRALDLPEVRPAGALLRADLGADRPLAALVAIELRERGVPVRVAKRPLGRVAARRALAGLEVGGAAAARTDGLVRRFRVPTGRLSGETGQALLIALGAVFAILVTAAVLTALGGAVTGRSRTQRAVDLAALSGARAMRDDFARLFAPARLHDGRPNPRHLGKALYLRRASAAARQVAARNGLDSAVEVSFPDARSFAPLRVAVRLADGAGARAEAEASPPASPAEAPPSAGGGYSGPFAYRQGKPMRPDVAAAFDRLAAAARRAGISLVINSAYRSDAEQARLFAANPDPRWVAPPGHSLHRCATELDLGPPSAYAWLYSHARRFGFLKRYPWEPWHFGYTRGAPPCSAAGNAVGLPRDGGERGASTGLPAFVPSRFRVPIQRAASRWNVSAGLLAAQLMAESNFNPFAVSGAGAQGIAQFMPGTAASYGLRDPFNALRAIDAQAHLMSDLLRQFGSVSLALAAYNAGPAPVAACHCVPDIPETQAYVARILGLMGGSGELVVPALEVRLVD